MNESGDRKAGQKGPSPPSGENDHEDYSDLARTQAKEGDAARFDANARQSDARQSDMTLIMNRAGQTGRRIGNLPPPQLPPFKLPTSEPPPAVAIADQTDLLARYSKSSPKSKELTTTRPGIELGRPLFAVVAIAILLAVGGLFIGGRPTAMGVGIGGLMASVNLWAFTRIGAAMLSGGRGRGAWGVVAILKLFALFGAVFWILKRDLADPLSFLIGYLALPIGIVASQFLGLRADFGNGEGSF
jgi:hypothetical protein